MSEEEKLDYLNKLRKECGFNSELQLEHIKTNPARCTTSKLLCNAVVGKLGKRKKKTRYV
jgi:hypothetical protein